MKLSTCHWCHVMERESFEDEEVARKLNESFVSIKVDREERPDVDSVYMDVCQRLTGSGGWPLSIFMTPDQKPFYAGTYFPKQSLYGRIGFTELLDNIKKVWSENKEELISKSEDILEHIKAIKSDQKADINKDSIELGYQQLMEDFDLRYGGFSHAPKFPTPHNLFFLFKQYVTTNNEDALNMCSKTLDGMYKGGMYDHIGGGFSRYSTDRKWLVPHFEKMLYDNALLIIAYTKGYIHTKKEYYKQIVDSTINYLVRDMLDESGGFYCAEDADSEGVEGKFYVFTKSEILEILGKDDGEAFCDLYGITEKGNFEGKNILNLLTTEIEDLDDHTELIEKSMQKILDYRNKRVRPHLDDKILTSWNGLIIAALAFAGKCLSNTQYIQHAENAAYFIYHHLRKEDGGLYVRYREGEAKQDGFLDDYVFMIWGLIETYEATFKPFYLEWAISLNQYLLSNFWDEEEGAFYLYGSESEALIMRPKEIYDGAIPSGNSVAALCLLKLSRLTGDLTLEEKAKKLISVFASQVNQYPRYYTYLLQGITALIESNRDIVIAGNLNDEKVQSFIHKLNKHYYSFFTVLLNNESKEIRTINPSLKEKGKDNDKNTVYICEDYACRAPITDLDNAIDSILGNS